MSETRFRHFVGKDLSGIAFDIFYAHFCQTFDCIIEIVKMGGNRARLVAKIAGGAQMFAFGSKSDMIRVGDRNVLASKQKLGELKIPLLAEDTGETYGRTVIFYPSTGDFVIRSVGMPEKVI